MKKSLSQAIALAALVGGATAAHAVSVNPDGIGGALVYPLYTVNDGNTSLVSVVNTTNTYKAVKVRFVEAKNSAEVLDFHLYLSPNDVWSGTIVPTATGAKLVSNDRSCIAGVSANDGTFPKDGLPFSTEQITMDEARITDASKRSTQAEKIARVRVGHFEAIEMGTIAAGLTPTGQTGNKYTLQEAILHTNGVPGSCDVVTNWWKKDLGLNAAGQTDRDNKLVGTTEEAPGTGIYVTAPTGGLYGTGGVVNVKAGWAASFDAVALMNAATPGPLGAGTEFYTDAQHPRPGSIYPHLGTVDSGAVVAENHTAATSNGLTPVTPVANFVVPSDTRLNEVTTALNVAAIYNDYYVEPALDAGTELVVTFPTKRFYTFETVDNDDAAAVAKRYIYTGGLYDFGTYANNGNATSAAAGDPEGDGWAKTVATAFTAPVTTASVFETRWDNVAKTARVGFVSPTLYGKDEQEITATDGFVSPRPIITGQIDLNYEANVIALNNSNALGTDGLVSVNVDTPFMEGWLRLNRTGTPAAAVPAVGFGVITTKNGVAADGALRNFAQTFKHKTVQ